MNNYKGIQLEDIYKQKKSFNEISLVGDFLFWKESVQISGKKNNAIFVRPVKKPKLAPQQLIYQAFSINSSFHGYGGRSYQCFKTNDLFHIVWIDQRTGSLWAQKYLVNASKKNISVYPYLISKEEPRQLTKSSSGNFDACFALYGEKFLFGLIEIKNNDFLFSVDINKKNQDLKIIKKFNSFAGSLSSNLRGNKISWIEWGGPYMPWENNELFFANISAEGEIQAIQKLNKSLINDCGNISYFQPHWLSEDLLVCSEDSSGWWNLIFIEVNKLNVITIKKKITKEFFEYGVPQWVSGISLFAGVKENFFCLARHKDNWILEHYKNLSFARRINLPFTNLSDLYSDSSKVILKASSNITEDQLLELDFKNNNQFYRETKLVDLSDSYSKAETFWFKGFDDKQTHAWIYKCRLSNFEKPPLIIKAHSGPTNYFNGQLNPEIEFWTSKGWFVAEINYGGSSGFGKEYRNRLNGNWGIVDSEDCKALAKCLISKGLVDESKIVIFGNSAGGFTALNSLCNENLFKAAICKYPVLDLNHMRCNTHRFEKSYLNSLIGDFDNTGNKYFDRSPINKIDQISQPVLLFHGKKDVVVDYKISLEFIKLHLRRNIHSEIHLYDNEGHGFRDLKNKLNFLLQTELFLKKIFFKN